MASVLVVMRSAKLWPLVVPFLPRVRKVATAPEVWVAAGGFWRALEHAWCADSRSTQDQRGRTCV